MAPWNVSSDGEQTQIATTSLAWDMSRIYDSTPLFCKVLMQQPHAGKTVIHRRGLLQTGCIIHWAGRGNADNDGRLYPAQLKLGMLFTCLLALTMTVPVLSRNRSHITRARPCPWLWPWPMEHCCCFACVRSTACVSVLEILQFVVEREVLN